MNRLDRLALLFWASYALVLALAALGGCWLADAIVRGAQ